LSPERRGHGLALVSEIAAAHGGRFAISRSPNGTVAALELPLAGPAAVAVA
jgi:signal transduction histidine kinase